MVLVRIDFSGIQDNLVVGASSMFVSRTFELAPAEERSGAPEVVTRYL